MASVTIEDFADWLDYHLEHSKREFFHACQKASAEASQHGRLHSSGCALSVIECGQVSVRNACEKCVGEFHRVNSMRLLPEIDLRTVLREKIEGFRDMVQAHVGHSVQASVQSPEAYEQEIEKIRREAEFALRHADTGLLRPPEPPMPPTMTNKIDIRTMTGGAIQQGTTGSTQNATVEVNLQAAASAVSQVQKIAETSALDPASLESIRGDLQTIMAQIRKPQPSRSILSESFTSLRKVAESAAGEAAATPLLSAAIQLGRAIGLG